MFDEEQIDNYVDLIESELWRAHSGHLRISRDHISAPLPDRLKNRMSDLVTDDLDEMACCFVSGYYAASTLMAFRVFERSIRRRVSVRDKVKMRDLRLSDAIKRIEGDFSGAFVHEMHKLRDMRNSGMHSAKRFDDKKAMRAIRLSLWLAVELFSS